MATRSRLFAASLVLVGIISTPVASFALQRTTTFVNLEDLFQDQSVNLAVKYHAKRPIENRTESQVNNEVPLITTEYSDNANSNYRYRHDAEVNTQGSDFKISTTNTKDTSKSQFSEITVSATVKKIKDDFSTTLDAPNTTERSIEQKETIFETNLESTPSSYAVTETVIKQTDKSQIPSITKIISIDSLEVNDTATEDNTYGNNKTTAQLSVAKDLRNKSATLKSNNPLGKPSISSKYSILKSTISPSWKKYTLIDRKRPSTTQETLTNINEKDETIVRAETVQSIFSLQNIITSDIPSLEQLKNDLLSSTTTLKASQKPIDSNETTSTLEQLKPIDYQARNSTESLTLISTTETSTYKPTNWDTVESKRAGYLDYSEKNVNKEISSENTTVDLKLIENDNLRAMFEPESAEHDIAEEKNISRLESQSQLNEDALKEELLKEELISDTEENAMREEVRVDKDISQSFPEVPEISTIPIEPQPNESILNVSTEDILKVQPINAEKKNATFYTVNPNYKPLKKLEVQSPKQFVRDPDDNSWRNESISSLGIVFNPKNSSKPFTQVLKNKTETEWNILLEKESKNDLPDLRERLEKMAKIRKTKKKKTDSMGNVVYVDYEESSGSVETSSKEDLTTPTPFPITSSEPIVSEVLLATEGFTTVPIDKSEDIVYDPTTIEIPRLPEKEKVTTKKLKTSFSLPEYYESIDEDDIDYLNLAKIDLKKHVTEKQKVVLVTPRARSFTTQRTTQNRIPEKVRTVQYFPPLTTQKVNMDEYDNDFKFKIDSFTTQAPSTNVLPISLPEKTIPVVSNINPQYISERENQKYSYVPIPNKPTSDQYSNKPQHTPQHKNKYTVINDEVNFNSDTNIRNYGDFINEAAKDSDFDKNADFFPYTQPPIPSITVNDIVKVEKDKDNPKFKEAFDYESQFRRDVIDRFVENFNRNSERFRPDFPVLFNSSIVHNDAQQGREVASSRSFLRGLYGSAANNNYNQKPPCDPNCDQVTVELSPAYELHYYVPEQEEKEEADAAPVTLPLQYKL